MVRNFRTSSLIYSSVSAIIPSLLISKYTDCKDDSSRQVIDMKQAHDVAMYLTPVSQSELQAHLKKLGIQGDIDTSRVVVRRSCDKDDSYYYEPLFGERAAFRLRGIIKTESGSVAGIGRVSTLAGELLDDDCDSSIAIKTTSNQIYGNITTHAIDLPTRLRVMKLDDGVEWDGQMTPSRILNEKYPTEHATFTPISKERQPVIAGILCSSQYVDDAGNCSFDRAKDMQHTGAPLHTPSSHSRDRDAPPPTLATLGKTSKNSKIDEESDGKPECPVCKYMKGGPCKQEFVGWEECVDSIGEAEDMHKCFQITMEMMKCMRANEYYDIMTAGTEEKYDAAEKASAPPPSSSSLHTPL